VGRPVSCCQEEGADNWRKRTTAHLTGEGDDAAYRGVVGGGEATTSPKMGTTRLAATSPMVARKKT
jgi:hypothetical protein